MTTYDIAQTLTVISAADLVPGDLIHYTPNIEWRVQSATPVGKSIDIEFICERSDLVPAAAGVGGSHRFRQSTRLLVMRDAPGRNQEIPESIPANDLEVGDVLHYTAAESWEVAAMFGVGLSVDVDFTVVRSENRPADVGVRNTHRFRRATNVLVTRA